MASQQRVAVLWFALVLSPELSGLAQRSGTESSSAGSGQVSPSVVATWEAHNQSSPNVAQDPASSPLLMDLLVLWRGNPGWFTGESGSGGSDHLHRVSTGNRPLELRFDPARDGIQVGGATFPLKGANVVLLDGAGTPDGVKVVGMLKINPVIPGNPSRDGPAVDQLGTMLRRSQELLRFLRCESDSADPDSREQFMFCQSLGSGR
jgi:hypothetical protein